MKALWAGNIVIGFINIPVKIYPMEKKSKVGFRLIHKKCGTPIEYKKWCPHCNASVSDEDIVKGVEIAKGEYVILEDEEIEALKPVTKHKIEIDGFVNFFEIDPHFLEKNYILVPNKSEEAYSVMLKAMEEKGKAAIGRAIIRRKEFPVVIHPYKGVLVLTALYYPDEIVEPSKLFDELGVELKHAKEEEVELAKLIIEQLTTKLDLEKYKDEYKEAIMNLVKKKLEGVELTERETEVSEEEIKNLMEALQATVKALKKKKKK